MWRLWQTILSWFLPGSGATIGWLCTVPQDPITTDQYLAWFKAGLADSTVTVKDIYGTGVYDDMNTDLKNKATQLVKMPIKVLVTVAGVRSLQAAVSVANSTGNNIPIIFLVGRDLKDNTVQHNNVKGGIDLNMPISDQDRVKELKKHPYSATNVGLLLNLNAAMGPQELLDWQTSFPGAPYEACGGPREPNDQMNLAQHVQNLINNGADAVIVSADPYFSSQRDTLLDLLYDVPVSYPFEHYRKAGKKHNGVKPGHNMRYGPDMQDGYQSLGVQVAQMIAGTPPGIKQIANKPVPW
jgi:hypothetical protein